MINHLGDGVMKVFIVGKFHIIDSDMPTTATVLFDIPQREIASLVCSKLAASSHIQIVAGFVTVEGMAAIEAPIAANAVALDTFVVGAGTYKAYEAFDRLLGIGVPTDRLYVHLGHTRATASGAKHRFYRYHPMLHSKVYYMEHADGTASAVIGSHNVTGFALMGLNGEAAVLLEGNADDAEFAKIRSHIAAAKAEALLYSPGMKPSLSWWTHQFVEGLAAKVNDAPRDGESKKTIVILCEMQASSLPKRKHRIYFELGSALGTVQSLRAEVHLYIFDKLPLSPEEGLASLDKARASFWCKTIGLETGRGGVELRAEWQLDDDRYPILKPTPNPFRPKPTPDMQQVRVEVYGDVRGQFEYLFDPPSTGWLPTLDTERVAQAPAEHQNRLLALNIVPPEHQPWFLVNGLIPADQQADSRYLKALENMSPEAGSYVLMSLRRRERTEEPNDLADENEPD